ncbi:MAG: hypothetical protein ACFUZC_08745 [Chthoniobacteraceae bacterium]
MKTPYLRNVILIALLVVCSQVQAATTTLLSDTFEGGVMTNWTGNGFNITANPATTSTTGSNTSTNVLETPGGTSRTVTIISKSTAVTSSMGESLQLSLQFDVSAADTYWNSHWYLLNGTSANSSSGYGFKLSGSTFEIDMIVNGVSTVLVSVSGLSSILDTTGWNTVEFTWAVDGTLTLEVNDQTVLQTTDTSITTAFAALYSVDFLNNSSTASGKVLYFDNIEVTAVPEPKAGALLGIGAFLGLAFFHRKCAIRRREKSAQA